MICSGGLGAPTEVSTPDFQTEILPIFQRHCLECHGNGDRQGELDLETLAGVRIGGHSGSPLLAEELNQSELYLRVTSTTAGYRMPKKGDPLSEGELQTLAAPRPHFGIRYEVELDQGKITKSSTLWMGSMYTLGGRVMVPDQDQVLLDRWFDWRPIPEIEGEGSSDPELLGLPEHLH